MSDDKAAFLRDVFNQVESQVQFGDSMASLLVAGDAILLGVSGGLIGRFPGLQEKRFSRAV